MCPEDPAPLQKPLEGACGTVTACAPWQPVQPGEHLPAAALRCPTSPHAARAGGASQTLPPTARRESRGSHGASGWSGGLGNIPSGKPSSASVVVCKPGKGWEHSLPPPSSHQDFTANIKSLDIRRISGDRVLKARISPTIFKHFPAESGCREKAEHCRDTNCSFLSLSSVTLKF